MIDLSALDIRSHWLEEEARHRKMLAILAHPDDESFGPGATLARYVGEGVEVHVLIMTDGSAGDLMVPLPPGVHSLSELRRHELQCAAQVLGVTAVHTLDYHDSGMPGTPANQNPNCLFQAERDGVIEKLCGIIRALRPQVVLTHDSTGTYFHPDHIRTHELASAAFVQAGDGGEFTSQDWSPHAPSYLYYYVIPKSRVKRTIWLARISLKDPRRWGRNGDVDLTQLGVPDEEVGVKIDVHHYLKKRVAAISCHRSQGGNSRPDSWLSQITRRIVTGTNKWEFFIQGCPRPASNAPLKTDFFL